MKQKKNKIKSIHSSSLSRIHSLQLVKKIHLMKSINFLALKFKSKPSQPVWQTPTMKGKAQKNKIKEWLLTLRIQR